jgi:hypothetical protein
MSGHWPELQDTAISSNLRDTSIHQTMRCSAQWSAWVGTKLGTARKFSSTRENPEATNAMIQKKKYGGRDRDRTGDPLLAKNQSPLQRLRPLFWFPMFSTIWGICFSLEAKPNAMKTFDSCTVRAQSPICIGDRSAVLQNPTASEEAAIIDGKRISKEHLMKVIRESFFQNLSSLHVTEYLWQICRRVQLFSKRKWALAV